MFNQCKDRDEGEKSDDVGQVFMVGQQMEQDSHWLFDEIRPRLEWGLLVLAYSLRIGQTMIRTTTDDDFVMAFYASRCLCMIRSSASPVITVGGESDSCIISFTSLHSTLLCPRALSIHSEAAIPCLSNTKSTNQRSIAAARSPTSPKTVKDLSIDSCLLPPLSLPHHPPRLGGIASTFELLCRPVPPQIINST